jgi:hypothetical protein
MNDVHTECLQIVVLFQFVSIYNYKYVRVRDTLYIVEESLNYGVLYNCLVCSCLGTLFPTTADAQLS